MKEVFTLLVFMLGIGPFSCGVVSNEVTKTDMVLIPEGEFTRGFDTRDEEEEWGDRDEEPVRTIYLGSYYIDRYEVTTKDFANFLNAHLKEASRYFKTDSATTIEKIGAEYRSRPRLEKYPANRVSWYGADAYCRFIGKRLPTEAEWEKAARGTDGRLFPWGNQYPDNTLVTFRRKFDILGFKAMEPVDSMPQGRSPYGLHHMAGNVWEWVADWYEGNYYEYSPQRDPKGPPHGISRVMRGGNWYYKAYYMRTVYRFNERPEMFKVWQGFRCAKGVH